MSDEVQANEPTRPRRLLRWIDSCLRIPGARIVSLKITRREFTFAGLRYKCGNGPWRETLVEAIAAHRYQSAYKAEQVKKEGTK